ncbi:CHASE2 domain-containing protein [Pelistega sp. MC2]|uniref:CHASE2 domain-containing protein n=1 Tax=Pelistega sp. MC2 TaxID=1720297 RepID=UPI0008D9D8A9|nr:CHASE2 domain-containing protein [Pelistega sp. MC2]
MIKSLSTRYKREFLGVSLFVSIITSLITFFLPINEMDNILYDSFLRQSHLRPASKDIVIITIDDKSLQELGTWPWRRVLHAQLLRHLEKAKSVGFDISFLGPSHYPEDDQEFARAIKQHGRVVLASFNNENHSPSYPHDPLTKEANKLGYINVPLESDSLVRQIERYIPDEYENQYHFSLAMLLAAGQDIELQNNSDTALKAYIPFSGPPNHYQTISYSDVLNFKVPEDMFDNKYVLVGAWATGLGDKFSTPTGRSSINMSGVEILANALQAEIEGKWIHKVSPTITLIFSLVWVLIYCVVVLILSPRMVFFASILLATSALVTHFLILQYLNLWVRLDPAIIGATLVYPLWTWRSQEILLKQMQKEIENLNAEKSIITMEQSYQPITTTLSGYNTFDEHINRLRSALARVRNLRQFITDSLDGMPYATAVFDADNQLLYSTAITEKYLAELGVSYKNPLNLKEFILLITANENITNSVIQRIIETSTMVSDNSDTVIESKEDIEFKDRANNDILIRIANTYTSLGQYSGFILTLIDISRIREQERQREQTLHFLSHDMRAPQSAIQALIKMQQNPQTALSLEDFLRQVNLLSRNTLNLVDNFLYLARAKNTSYQLLPINLLDLLQNVVDNFWSIAKARQITLAIESAPDSCYIMADGTLLSRAFNNLIDNAIKYGKDGMHIALAITEENNYWHISIKDQGIGIAQEDFERIFQVFGRAPQMETKRISGLGLGLAFVHTVIVGHQGSVTLESTQGVGTTFHIYLPILHDEESVLL